MSQNVSVAMLLRFESIDAAKIAATTSPAAPSGNCVAMKCGKTLSGAAHRAEQLRSQLR